MKSVAFNTLRLLAGATALLVWSGPGTAAIQQNCILGSDSKVCLSIGSLPEASVQPFGLAGTPTYVRYDLKLENTTPVASSRFLTLDLALVPATALATGDGVMLPDGCGISGASLHCELDKLASENPVYITLIAEAPPDEGEATAPAISALAIYGWQGRTQTLTHTLAVDDGSGSSYVRPGESVTLVTSADDDVTPEHPLWGSMTTPPRPVGYYASIRVIDNGPDYSASCLGGMFYLSATQAAVCRAPDHPGLWVESVFEQDDQFLFTSASPLRYTMKWDASIVPTTQQAPTPATPTGLPAWAIFHNWRKAPAGYDGSMHAFSDACAAAAPVAPCIDAVTRLENGDWQVDFLKPNDGSDANTDPLLPLTLVLNYLLAVADAGIIDIGNITN